MKVLNNWLNALQRLQLYNYGESVVVVRLPSGDELNIREIRLIESENNKVVIETE